MPKKILVVDDSAQLHQIYKMLLMRYTPQVIPALSGQDGLHHLHGHPDTSLLIVDSHMPRMSGLEFIRKVKEEERFSNIPIIFIDAQGMEEDAAKARALAQGSLRKPFTSSELHAQIDKLFPQGLLTTAS
jgi:CheY-like chemotaxis protein